MGAAVGALRPLKRASQESLASLSLSYFLAPPPRISPASHTLIILALRVVVLRSAFELCR